MRKIIVLLLALSAVFIVSCENDSPEPPVTDVLVRDGISYKKVTDDKVTELKVTGYTGNEKNLSIPSEVDGIPVKVIDDNAFKGKTGLESINLPTGLREIGSYAFADITTDFTLTIPTKVTVGSYAFSGSTGIRELKVPEGMSFKSPNIFNGWTDVQIISFATRADMKASGNDWLKDSNASCKYRDEYVDENGAIFKKISGKEELELVDGSAVSGKYTVPANVDSLPVTGIGNAAFCDNSTIKEIVIPATISQMGVGVFKDSSIEKAIMNCVIEELPADTFKSCANIISVDLPDTLKIIGEEVFWWAGSSTTSANPFKIEIPASVEKIGKKAFAYSRIYEVTFAATDSKLTEIEDEAFLATPNISSIILPEGLLNIGNRAFNSCEAGSVTLPSTLIKLGDSAFYGCDFDLNLPANLKYIGGSCFGFNNDSAQTVSIPDSVEYIGAEVFYSWNEGSEIIISEECKVGSWDPSWTEACPCKITYVGLKDHENISYRKIVDPKTETPAYQAVAYKGTVATEISIPADIEGIPVESLSAMLFKGHDELVKVVLPDSIHRIGSSTFAECTKLETVVLGSAITSIPDKMFELSTKLANVTIPENVAYIGLNAFNGCKEIKSLTLPSSVKVIGQGAFMGCTGFTTFTIPSTVEKVNSWAFDGWNEKQTIIVEENSTYNNWASNWTDNSATIQNAN